MRSSANKYQPTYITNRTPASAGVGNRKGKLVAPTRRPGSMTARDGTVLGAEKDPVRGKGKRLGDDVAPALTRARAGPASFTNTGQQEKPLEDAGLASPVPEARQRYRIISSYHQDANHTEDVVHEDEDEETIFGGSMTTFPVRLNPEIFNTENCASHSGAVVAYFATSPTGAEDAAANEDNEDFTTDPPVKKVRVTAVQTIAFQKDGVDDTIEVLRRYTVSSLDAGITIGDICHLLGRYDPIDGVVEIRTILGANTHVEILGAVIQE